MMTRREAVASIALLQQFMASTAAAQTSGTAAPTPRAPLFKHDLPNITMDDWEVTVSHVDYPPGRASAPHKHAGFVLAYVLEGKIATQVLGEGVQGDERVYSPGEMFYEPPGSTHQVSKNASDTQPAKLLAMIFAKKGATLTTPVQRPGRDGGE